jgi:hypothetical protein
MCAKSLYIFLVTDVNVGNRMDQASIVVRGERPTKRAQHKRRRSGHHHIPRPHTTCTYKERKKIKPIIFLCWKRKSGRRVREWRNLKSFPKKWICVVCAVWIHLFGDEGGGKKTC